MDNKQKLNMSGIVIITLLVCFMFIAWKGIQLENQYNECAIKFNNCSRNCNGIKVINNYGYSSLNLTQLGRVLVPNSTINET